MFADNPIRRHTIPHYYGDMVRRLFLSAGIIMVLFLPYLNDYLDMPTIISMITILVVVIVAGITNPKHIWIALLNVLVSLLALTVFEFYSVNAYIKYSFFNLFFIINQVLALIFLFALYYSSKTLRGEYLR